LVRVFAHQGVVAMLGAKSLEYWAFTGDASFPFARVLSSQFGWGIAALNSIAAVESYGVALMRRRGGGLAVCRIGGGEPELISPPEICALFDAYDVSGDVTDAVGTGFSIAGHPMYQITFPNAGASWLLDMRNGVWSQRKSYELTYYRGVYGVRHLGATYWGDYKEGIIWKQSAPTITSDKSMDWSSVVWIEGQDAQSVDRPVPFEVVSEHIHAAQNRRFNLDWLEIGMEAGVGTDSGQGLTPVAMLSISQDRGKSFGDELQASIGPTGAYRQRVRWHRLGQYRDAVAKIRITDPVPRVITDEVTAVRGGVH